IEEPRTEHLGAGAAARNTPSRDGEYLDGEGCPDGSNANVFLRSICDVKAHKKDAVPEELIDNGIGALVGLEFIAGKESIKREGLEGASRPTLVAAEIVSQPKAGKKKSKSKDEDDEEDDKPKRRSSKASSKDEDEDEDEDEDDKEKDDDDEDDDADSEKDAEKAVIDALASPKYRKGIPTDKLYVAVLAKVRDSKNREDIMGLVEDEKWVANRKRPWNVEDDTVVAV
ncbi:MAG: hypothetical protein ACRD1Z_10315, partial [Vicinamibacteria bacterium]